MLKINLKELAKSITIVEGGKVNLSIAQVSELIRCLNNYYSSVIEENGIDGVCAVLSAINRSSKK